MQIIFELLVKKKCYFVDWICFPVYVMVYYVAN